MDKSKHASVPTLNIIAAACENMGIGFQGSLPWQLKKEMRFFKEKTSTTSINGKQNAVIMGRKTWVSIPEKYRPLPGRINVVLSTSIKELPGADYVSSSLSDAVSWLTSTDMKEKVEKLFVIGGSDVYKLAISSNFKQRIYLTRIMRNYECDTFFPKLDESTYEMAPDLDVPQGVMNENGVSFQFEVYVKKEKS